MSLWTNQGNNKLPKEKAVLSVGEEPGIYFYEILLLIYFWVRISMHIRFIQQKIRETEGCGNTQMSKVLDRDSCCSVTKSCPALCNPMAYTVHGILQARIPEWVAVPFSRGSSQPMDWTQVRHCRRILYQLSHQGSPLVTIILFY